MKAEKTLENIPGILENKHLTHTNKPQTNTNQKKTWKQQIYDPGLLNTPDFLYLLSTVIFFLNLGGCVLGGFWRVGTQLVGVFPQVKEGAGEIVNSHPYI